MTTILKLKVRERSDSVTIGIERIRSWINLSDEEAKQAMFEYFKPIKENEPTVHDKVFLANIINWVPIDERSGRPKGLPLTEQVRWYKLADRLDDVDDEEEGEIGLANKDIDAIMERIKSSEYKPFGLAKPYREFLTDFLRTTHNHIDEYDPNQDDEEAVTPDLVAVGIAEDVPVGENQDGRDKVPA